MVITKIFKDAFSRQANKAVRSSNRLGPELLNSKSEFLHLLLARVDVERKDPISVGRNIREGFKKRNIIFMEFSMGTPQPSK